MAVSLYELMLAEMAERAADGDPPAAEGATDCVGLRERISRARCTVDGASRGEHDSDLELNLEEARQQVRDAQSALVSMGYGIGIDAVWGPHTLAALRAFQDEHGLPVSGHLDASTYEALMALYEEAVETQSPLEPADDYLPMPGRRY